MSWRKKLTDHIGDTLRFAGYLFLALDAIVLSVFLFWFIVRFICRFAQYIDHCWFQSPWY